MTAMGSGRAARRVGTGIAGIALAVTMVGVSPAGAQTNEEFELVAEYADAVFTRRDTTLHLAPGLLIENGVTTEVVEARVTKESCAGGYLIEVDATASLQDDDIAGLEVDVRGGSASIDGVFPFEGTVTVTPARSRCSILYEDAAVEAPLETEIDVIASWRVARGARPVIYSGAECGGNGICYYIDATARADWVSDFIGDGRARSDEAFLFEGTYYGTDAASVAQRPSV